jgi:hypothetical protein
MDIEHCHSFVSVYIRRTTDRIARCRPMSFFFIVIHLEALLPAAVDRRQSAAQLINVVRCSRPQLQAAHQKDGAASGGCRAF